AMRIRDRRAGEGGKRGWLWPVERLEYLSSVDSDAEVARARLGRTVGGRWLLERVLGTGGMGAVYAARGPDGLVAAVKILHPEMGARREVRERFLREG